MALEEPIESIEAQAEGSGQVPAGHDLLFSLLQGLLLRGYADTKI